MKRLGEVGAGDWLVYNYKLGQLSLDSRCPECGTRNMCSTHHYAYLKWFYGLQKGVDVMDDEFVTVFETKEEAEVFRRI